MTHLLVMACRWRKVQAVHIMLQGLPSINLTYGSMVFNTQSTICCIRMGCCVCAQSKLYML